MNATVRACVSVAIVAVIVLLTLIFEKGHHWLAHHRPAHQLAFVEAFMRVLATLGLLSFALFMSIYSGLVTYANDRFLGESEVERVAKHELQHHGESTHFAPTELSELVEDISQVLFITMCLYLVLAVVGLLILTFAQKRWEAYDRLTYPALRWRVSHSVDSAEMLPYWVMRTRFLHPASGIRPSTTRHPVKFSFAEYLARAETKLIQQLIRIDGRTWFASLALLALSYPFLRSGAKDVVIYWVAGASVCLFVVTLLLWERLAHGANQLTPGAATARQWVLDCPTEDQFLQRLHSEGILLERNYPLVSRPWYSGRYLNGQERLMWLGKGFTLSLIQFVIFIQVIFMAFCSSRLLDPWWRRFLTDEWESDPNVAVLLKSALMAPLVISGLTLLFAWRYVIHKFALVTSLEYFVDHDIVDEMDAALAVEATTARRAVISRLVELTNQFEDDNRDTADDNYLSDYELFASLPLQRRKTLMELHKLLRTQRITPHDAIRVLAVPESLHKLFNEAPHLSDQQFIGRLLVVAFTQSYYCPQTREAVNEAVRLKARAIARKLFAILDKDNDNYVGVTDLEYALQTTKDTAAPADALRAWFSEELTWDKNAYLDQTAFVEAFADVLEVSELPLH